MTSDTSWPLEGTLTRAAASRPAARRSRRTPSCRSGHWRPAWAMGIVLCMPFVILAIGIPIALCVRFLLWIVGMLWA